MEIERKYLLEQLPADLDLSRYPCLSIEQGYLCTEPVIRIRRMGEQYILTYKSKGLMIREEHEMPLTKESYEHLLPKIDGILLQKKRYQIPYGDYTIELDIFSGTYDSLILAEIEFPDKESAEHFDPPAWLGRDVTFSGAYQNNVLSLKNTD